MSRSAAQPFMQDKLCTSKLLKLLLAYGPQVPLLSVLQSISWDTLWGMMLWNIQGSDTSYEETSEV